jgi:hypothetical protein
MNGQINVEVGPTFDANSFCWYKLSVESLHDYSQWHQSLVVKEMHNTQITIVKRQAGGLESIPGSAVQVSLVDNLHVNTTVRPTSGLSSYVIVSPSVHASSNFKASFKFSFYEHYPGWQKEQDDIKKAKEKKESNQTEQPASADSTNDASIPEGLTPEETEEYLKQRERRAYLAKFRLGLPENKGHTRVNQVMQKTIMITTIFFSFVYYFFMKRSREKKVIAAR